MMYNIKVIIYFLYLIYFTLSSKLFAQPEVGRPQFPKDIFENIQQQQSVSGQTNPDLQGHRQLSVRFEDIEGKDRLVHVLKGGDLIAWTEFDPELMNDPCALSQEMYKHADQSYGRSSMVGSTNSFGTVTSFAKPGDTIYIIVQDANASIANPTNWSQPGSEYERLTPGAIKNGEIQKIYTYEGVDDQGRALMRLTHHRQGGQLVPAQTKGGGLARIPNHTDANGNPIPFDGNRKPTSTDCTPCNSPSNRRTKYLTKAGVIGVIAGSNSELNEVISNVVEDKDESWQRMIGFRPAASFANVMSYVDPLAWLGIEMPEWSLKDSAEWITNAMNPELQQRNKQAVQELAQLAHDRANAERNKRLNDFLGNKGQGNGMPEALQNFRPQDCP